MSVTPIRLSPRSLAVAALLAIASSALSLAGPSSAVACDNVEARPASTSLGKIEDATRCLLNQRRAKLDLKKLDENGRLEDAATRHSRDMADHNYFSHTSRDGDSLVDRIRQTGYLSGSRSWLVGVGLARGAPRSGVGDAATYTTDFGKH